MSFLNELVEVAIELTRARQTLLNGAHHQQNGIRSYLLVSLLERLEVDGLVRAEEVV